jgi:regulator of protease activity HflC (stomatin/prohibitin superfamily)
MFHKIFVGDQERVLALKKGRFYDILGPGEHILIGFGFTFQKFQVRDLYFENEWSDFIRKQRPAIAEEHFTIVETGDAQVAVIFQDGKLSRVMAPGKRAMFWRGSVAISAQVFDVKTSIEVPREMQTALTRLGGVGLSGATTHVVDEGKTGLLFVDSRFVRLLSPGTHMFWAAAGAIRVDVVDLRAQAIEVPGQEILTRDKVSLRVNIWAEFQVTDAVQARSAVKDFMDALYKSLQFAVRQSLGKRSLDEVLAEKVDVSEDAAAKVRADMAALGVRVGAIAIKDVILPGEMRDILNQVVTAEKQAQANLIRRREETAATRSLLNTAKLLEDNPILLRLKELETLERVVEKVDRISINGGLDSLLGDLVRIRNSDN